MREAVKLSTVPAAIVLAVAGALALLVESPVVILLLAGGLLMICLRAPVERRRFYLIGALTAGLGVFLLSPLLAVEGINALWRGPVVPVLGPIDVTSEEIRTAAVNGLRLTAIGLAFTAYALLLDHDGLLASASFARRSALAVALATRLIPTLERDAAGFAEALEGRGMALQGVRDRARLLSPVLGNSLDRASMLAEAMEARGFGRPGSTRAPRPGWTLTDRCALVAAGLALLAGVVWL